MEILGFTLTVLFTLPAGYYYCHLALKEKANPSLGSWIIFVIGSALSLATSLSESPVFIDNAYNSIGLLSAVGITAVLIHCHVKMERRIRRVEVFCLISTGVILCLWLISRAHAFANGLVQIIMAIGYWPMAEKLLKEDSEPLSVWTSYLLASLAGCYLSYLGRNWVAAAYSLRSVVCVAVVILLTLRLRVLRKMWGRAAG